MTSLVLASASPRRRELLGRLGVAFEVRPADVDETARPGEGPADLVARLAAAKAEAVLAAGGTGPDVVVLAADTVVVLDGRILGKPAGPAAAAEALAGLSGRTHRVLTGVAVGRRSGAADEALVATSSTVLAVEVATTEVTVTELTPAEIDWYVATGEPLDKAGAYGVQGAGAVFVSSIHGSWDNVVGLPLAVARRLLAGVGADPLGSAAGAGPAGTERR